MILRFLASHRRLRLGAVAGLCLGVGWGILEGVFWSDWFGERVRTAAVRELAAASGGIVTIGGLERGPSRLSFDLLDVAIKSGERPDSPPVLRIPRISTSLGWAAVLGGRVSLDSLAIHDPVLQIEAGNDGESNIPIPPQGPLVPDLEVREFTLSGGRVLWNRLEMGVQFTASDLDVSREYDPVLERYVLEATLRNPVWDVAGRSSPPADVARLAAVSSGSGVEIQSASLFAEAYSLEVSGTLSELHRPRFDGTFTLAADVGALADWLLEPEPPWSGNVRAQGDVRWDAISGLQYHGTLAGEDLRHSSLDADAAFTTPLAGDGDGFELKSISATLLGGAFAGSAALRDLTGERLLSASGSVNDVTLASLVSAAGMGKVPWSGSLNLEIDASGSHADGLDVRTELVVNPAGGAAALPVEGKGALRYVSRTNRVHVSALNLATPNAEIAASGSVGLDGEGALEVEASMESLQAGERILALVHPSVEIPANAPDGRYTFRGTLRERIDRPAEARLEGEFAIEDFLFGGQRWEQLTVSGVLSAESVEAHHGQLRDGDGTVTFHGSLPLLEEGVVDITARASGIDTGKLAKAGGFGLPIDGSLSMNVSVAGTLQQPRAQGRIELAAPSFFGEPFESLSAEAVFEPDRFEVRNATLVRGSSTLQASASLKPDSDDVEFQVESNRWPLDSFAWLQVLSPGISGDAGFNLRASGRATGRSNALQELELEGSWDIRNLRRDELELGQWRGELRSQRGHPSVVFEWTGDALGGGLTGQATFVQSEPASYNGSIAFHELGIPSLASLIELPMGSFEGEIGGQATFGGVAGVADTFELSGTIDQIEARLPREERNQVPYRVSNVFPARWTINGNSLRLDSMHLNGPGTDLEIDGMVGFGDDPKTDVELDGTVDLGMLGDLPGGLQLGGKTEVELRLAGDLRDPKIEGSVEFAEAAVRTSDVQFGLNQVRGRIHFQEGLGRIDRLTAAFGGGTVSVDGTTALENGEFEYRLNARAQDMRVDFPESVSSVIDGQFTLAGVGTRSILSGDAVISSMSTRDNVTFAELFESIQQPEVWQTSIPALADVQLNVQIGAVRQLPIETSLVREIEADFDINVVGSIANPSILGSIGIAQGEIRMLGTRYRINRGEIRFVNPIRAEPVLNVELETRIRDVDITLVLSGPTSKLDLSYRSDPPLPFYELVDLVAVGKEPTIDPGIATRRRIEQQSLVQTGADTLLSQTLERPVSQRLQRFFGVSRLKVDPQVGGLEANPSARISTEQQLADDLTLIYSYDLSSAQQQAIRIEWNPDRKWSVVVTRDQNGLVGSDVLYKVRLP